MNIASTIIGSRFGDEVEQDGHGVPERSLKMNQHVMKFLREEDGLTTVEYAIAGGLVGAAVIAAFTILGTTVGAVITRIIAALTPAATGVPVAP